MKKNEQAQIILTGIGGRGNIDTIAQIFDKANMYDEIPVEDLIWERKKTLARRWLQGIRLDVPVSEDTTVKIRGCHNIKSYKNGQVVREYALLDFMTGEELYSIIDYHESMIDIHRAIANHLKKAIPEQLSLF